LNYILNYLQNHNEISIDQIMKISKKKPFINRLILKMRIKKLIALSKPIYNEKTKKFIFFFTSPNRQNFEHVVSLDNVIKFHSFPYKENKELVVKYFDFNIVEEFIILKHFYQKKEHYFNKFIFK
jgi:hypothetical protein